MRCRIARERVPTARMPGSRGVITKRLTQGLVRNLVGRLEINRKQRSAQIVRELFPRQTGLPVTLGDLSGATIMVREVEKLQIQINQMPLRNPNQEMDALRGARDWFSKVASLIEVEPGLDLLQDFRKKQPAVQPAELEPQPQEAAAA